MLLEFQGLLNMVRVWVRWMFCASVLFVSACAAPHTEIPFDRSTTPAIKTISIASPAFPSGASVVLASLPGQGGFGLLGGLASMVASGMQTERETTINKLLTSKQYDAKGEFVRALQDALQRRGYQTVLSTPTREKPDEFAAAAAFKDQPAADAYLDVVVVRYGFLSSGVGDSRPYRPMIHLSCRLISKDFSRVVMFDSVLVNPLGTPEDAIQVSPLPDYAFVDFDTLMVDPAHMMDGLTKTLDQGADTIGTLLN